MSAVLARPECSETDTSRIWNTAYTTATEVQNQLEQRARAAGVPVDQYKTQAYETAEELRKQAERLAQQVQERAKEMGRNGQSGM